MKNRLSQEMIDKLHGATGLFPNEEETTPIKENSYIITYENGATLYMRAENLVQAIEESVKALMSCMPKGFDQNNLVRPIEAKQIKGINHE